MSGVTLSELERDTLQEIINIGFGLAAAELADIIGLHVHLSVPLIDAMKTEELIGFINRQIPESSDMGMVSQFFSGKFNGASFLVFPKGEGLRLFTIFDTDGDAASHYGDLDMLQRETLIEVGNIIIGACVGKVAEILGDTVNYTPPRYFSQELIPTTLDKILENRGSFAILFETIFDFEEENIKGYLFLISSFDVMTWLKQAIERYISQYE